MNMLKPIIFSMMMCTAQIAFGAQPTGPEGEEYKWIKMAQDTKDSAVQSVRMRDCPIIGNLESGIYHTPRQPHYARMLIKNRYADEKGGRRDNRRCFETEEEARETLVMACPLDASNRVVKCTAAQRVERFYVKARTLENNDTSKFLED